MMGTPKILSILQKEFQQAKRGSGQGDLLWPRMEQGEAWDLFVESMWDYQYTKENIKLSRSFIDALYGESQGIPFLAAHIYKLVQEDAILSGKEAFQIAQEAFLKYNADVSAHVDPCSQPEDPLAEAQGYDGLVRSGLIAEEVV